MIDIDVLSNKVVRDDDSDRYHEPKVRGRYGILCSVVSIILNLVISSFKLILGFATNSVAIIADGFNNLSDVASSVATLLGFVFSLKDPDKEHPFGHGRLEYLTGLIISVLIIFVGLQTLRESINHMITPQPVYFSQVGIVVLLVSIILKYLMGRLNLTVGARINSTALIAAGRDSKVDILATIATLIALVCSLYTELPVDGILGAVVSLIILKTGYEIAKETITSLLGAPPDENLLEALSAFTATHDRVLGTHDLMIHDYGPGRKYLTLHVEVNKNEDMMAIHDVIDKIERDIYRKFKIKATIHLDPIDLDDELTRKMKEFVTDIVTLMNVNYSIHDFRIRQIEQKVTLIFDVTIPADDVFVHDDLIKHIDNEIKKSYPNYDTLIEIDHSYT